MTWAAAMVHDYLVRVSIDLPEDMDDARKTDLIDAERTKAVTFIRSGHLNAIWRVPGRFANVAIWRASDATELHDMLTSLPLFPWMKVTVEPLARHPLADAVRPRGAE